MTSPDILIGWDLLSKSQQMDIKQSLPPNFTSYLSKNDVAKLVSKRRGKKNRNTARIIKVKSVTPPKLLAKLLAKFHSFVKRDKDGVPKLDLVKIISFLYFPPTGWYNSENASGVEASEAWQAAIKMFILCKLKKVLPIDLSKKEIDCHYHHLSVQQHSDVQTAIEKWWQQYCIWNKRENAERTQLDQYIEFVKQVREQEGSNCHESEFNVVILTRLEQMEKSRIMKEKFEKKLQQMILFLSKSIE